MYGAIPRLRIISVLLGVLCLGSTMKNAYSQDPLLDLLEANALAIHSMEVRFRFTAGQGLTREHWLRLDNETGWCAAKMFISPVNPESGLEEVFEDEYGLDGKVAWSTVRMRDGTRRIDLTFPRSSSDEKASLDSHTGYAWLREAYEPWHMRPLKNSANKIAMIDKTPSPEHEGAVRLRYRVTMARSGNVVEVAYDVDMKDGVKLLRTETRRDGKRRGLVANSEFHKIDGIWLAFKSEQQSYDSRGTPEPGRHFLIEIQEVALNRAYAASDFSPKPEPGDLIWDSIAGLKYRFGSDDRTVSPQLDLPPSLSVPSAIERRPGPATTARDRVAMELEMPRSAETTTGWPWLTKGRVVLALLIVFFILVHVLAKSRSRRSRDVNRK